MFLLCKDVCLEIKKRHNLVWYNVLVMSLTTVHNVRRSFTVF